MDSPLHSSPHNHAEMRRTLVRNLLLLTLFTVGTILTVAVVGTRNAVEDLSWSLMDRTAELAESHLDGFFTPMGDLVGILKTWGKDNPKPLDIETDVEQIQETLWPIAISDQRISGIIIANDRGEEYFLHKEKDGWSTRQSGKPKWHEKGLWKYWNEQGELQRSEWKPLDYDPRKRPWFEGALTHSDPDQPAWTDAYTFFTSKAPGITASLSWSDASGTRWVVAMDLLLREISRFTTELKVGEHGFLMVFAPGPRVLGLPRHPQYQDPDRLDQDLFKYPQDLNLPVVTAGLKHWKTIEDGSGDYRFRFTGDSEFWWARIMTFQLGSDESLYVVVGVPEDELLAPVKQQRNQILAIAAIALLVSTALAFAMDRSFRKKLKQAVDEARQLGQYTLEEKIGDGAMGAVYRARHAMLRRPTAIKLLHPDRAANEASLARFENEVQITGCLNHPNTVALYDYGHTPNGLFYYVMEYLQGIELEDLVQRGGPLPPGRAIHILVQICGSLDEAHRLGLIHRDIKPANIMLIERGGDDDFVKVLDFGLVKDLDDRDQAGLTNVDTLTGTPLYMSPEAIQSPEQLSPASDIYAIGALGYFLLTGQPVFDGKNIVDICAKHIHDAPQPPHERLGHPLPADLEGIILQCLAKKPQDRPPGADILANALEHCQDAGSWNKADSHDWWQQHRDLFRQPGRLGDHQDMEQDHLTIDLQSRAI